MKKAKKKVVKKVAKKVVAKKRAAAQHQTHSTEIVLRVAPAERVPTTDEIAEPMRDGKNLAIAKTWVSSKQILRMVQRTPPEHIYERPAKGGGKWKYVTGSYVEKVLNFTFGFLWDFEITSHGIQGNQVWVLGKLTVKNNDGQSITKTQFGRADIKFRKDSKDMLDFGNDLKSAATDALKKCSSLFGIASDVYGKMEYKQETGYDTRDNEPPQDQSPTHEEPSVQVEENGGVDLDCHGFAKTGCPEGKTLKKQERDFSMRFAKKPLCRNCFAQWQQAHKKK